MDAKTDANETQQILYYTNFDLESIVTPVNVDAYEQLLVDSTYDIGKSKYLVDGFRHGFSLEYHGPRNICREAPNLKFRIGNEIQLWNKVMKEIKLGRYAGPFKEPPFKHYIQSPIGLVPKDGGADTRLIFHLSYPRNGKGNSISVNGCTPSELCKVQYPDFSDAIQSCIAEGKCCYCGKSDMRSAFRNVGISRRDWPILLMKCRSPIDNQMYYMVDKCLPFGHCLSCKIFQEFSNSVAHIVRWKLNMPSNKRLINYLDDYFFVALMRWICNNQIKCFLEVCKLINFPISMEKTSWASQCTVFLGFLIDTVRQMIGIPMEKITKGINMLNFVLGKRKVTILQLQKICGFLNFLSRAIVPGRAFTRRLYGHTAGTKLKQHHHLNINREMRLDLTVWLEFLKHPAAYNRPFMDFSDILTADELNFYTDSSKNPDLGCGGYFNKDYFYIKWSKNFIVENDPSITYLELYAVAVALLSWGERLANTRSIIFCDNIGACAILNFMSSSCKNCMILIRLLVMHQMVS